jgi:hypothetical protein
MLNISATSSLVKPSSQPSVGHYKDSNPLSKAVSKPSTPRPSTPLCPPISIDSFLEEDNVSSSVSTARITYFFDDSRGGSFLSIPHLGRSGSASTAGITRILETWLSEKIANPVNSTQASSSIIPILEEPIQQVTDSITSQLQAHAAKYLSALSKVYIQVQTGHVFDLSKCCDDSDVLWAAQEFYQQYPLFLDLTIWTRSLPTPGEACVSKPLPATSSTISKSSYSSTTYSKMVFDSPSHHATELLLHFLKTYHQ